MTDHINLEEIIAEEKRKVAELREKYGYVFATGPETPTEYYDMKNCYDSIGPDAINDFRIMMGYISNPSMDMETKEAYIQIIPHLLNSLEEDGKDVQYLRVAYNMVLKYGVKKNG